MVRAALPVLAFVLFWATVPQTSAQEAAALRAALHNPASDDKPKSVPLALGLSAVVPGAGQVYNGGWVKASVAVAAEAGILWAWASWRSKGNDGRDAYQAMAHAHWSAVRYAHWLNDYTAYLNSLPAGPPINTDPILIDPALGNINLMQPGTWSMEEQLAVRQLFVAIRRVEGQVYHPETGARFSHVLPFFGEQQYYELVGKYFQFAPGWDDYRFLVRDGKITWIDADGNFIKSIDPEKTGPGNTKPNVSSRFYDYAVRHSKANDYLRRASRMTVVLMLNHLLAAADAAITARLHNNRLRTRVAMVQQQVAFSLQYTF